jgi:hypothetical protein
LTGVFTTGVLAAGFWAAFTWAAFAGARLAAGALRACDFPFACCGRAGACLAAAALCVFAFAAVFVAAWTFAPLEWDAGVFLAGAFLACLRAVLLKMGASVQGELKKERNYSMRGVRRRVAYLAETGPVDCALMRISP